MTSGGIKYDQNKPDLSMVSYDLMEEVAYVRMFGEKKYARDNWKRGFKVTRSCAAALRHIFLFLSGETNDSESGRSHLAHAVCCLEHAIYDMRHHPENDDRAGPADVPQTEYQALKSTTSYNDWIAP
jgi:hypothetical protein